MADFYQPSGALPPASFLAIPAGAAAASCILAPLYAATTLLVPFVYVNAVTVIGYGLAAGFAAGLAARASHCRNPAAAAFLTFVGSLPGLYLAWAFWLYLVAVLPSTSWPGLEPLKAAALDYRSWLGLARQPDLLLDLAAAVNFQGVWAVGRSSANLTGTPLLIVWIAEALVFLVAASRAAAGAVSHPYSEEARAWLPGAVECGSGLAVPEEPGRAAEAFSRIASGDLGYLAGAPLAAAGGPALLVSFRSLDSSPWGTVTVRLRDGVGGKSGKIEEKELAKDVVAKLSFIATIKARLA
jgi:hypothetical protein